MSLSLKRGSSPHPAYVDSKHLQGNLESLPPLKAVVLLLNDVWWGIGLLAGNIGTDFSAPHAELSDESSLQCIEEVFQDYKRYGHLEKFNGIAAEVGPGDNVGVSMLMRQDGCHQVDLIDRYENRRDLQRQGRIYQALSKKHGLEWLRTDHSTNNWETSGLFKNSVTHFMI